MEFSEEYNPKKQDKPSRKTASAWLSRLYLLAAVALVVYTCALCCPSITERVRQSIGAAADSRAVQAFSSLTQSLREGDGVVEAFSASYRVLSGATH